MAIRTRFVLLFVVVVSLFGRCMFAQEPGDKKPAESAVPSQTSVENARVRTHCELSSCVEKILYLSNISQPSELQDVVNAMRTIAEIQRVQQIPGEHLVIIEGTGEQVALGEKLAAEIDKERRRFGGLGYQVDLRVRELQGDKNLHPLLYSFVSEAGQSVKLNIGRQSPLQPQSASSSDSKQSSDSSGDTRSIECRVLAEHEHAIQLNVEVNDLAHNDDQHEAGAAAQALLRFKTNVTVELDKPTIVGRVEDPDSGHSFAIELTARRIKSML